MLVRKIKPADNVALAKIIRDSLLEFTTNLEGTVYYDSSTDHLYELFKATNSTYFVVIEKGEILGGGGLFPTEGLPFDTIELVKMYLHQSARGKGIGLLLLKKCIETAKELGYKRVYLETLPVLKNALKLYEKFGFKYIQQPMGSSGHTGCDLWMIYEIED